MKDSGTQPHVSAGQVWLVVIAAALGWFFDAVILNVYTVTLPQIVAEFKLSVGIVGILASLFLAGYGIGTMLGGTLADFLGRRTALGLSILGYTIFSGVTALAPNAAVFGALRFLTGIGCGAELPVGAAYVAEVVEPKHRGFFVGMMNSVFSLGLFLSIGLAAVFHSWRWTFASLLVLGLLIYFVRSRAEESPRFLAVLASRGGVRTPMGEAIKRVFSGRYQPITLRVMIMWIGYWVAWWGWSIFVPRYLVEAVGVKPPQVLFTMGCFAFAAFLVQLSVGWFCDVFGRKATIVAFSILAVAFAWWWSLAPGGPSGVWIGGAAFALMLGPPGALVAYTSELFPTALRGTGQSFTMGVARIVSIAAPGLGGFIAGRLSQGAEMRIVTGFLVITILATMFGTETKAVELEDQPEEDLAAVAAVPARAI